jgi:hypothetical protein
MPTIYMCINALRLIARIFPGHQWYEILDEPASSGISGAVRTANFWLLMAGATLVIGAINSVIQHFILSMKDAGYSTSAAARLLSILLAMSLGGRVLVGYLADHYKKKSGVAA